jgi:elongation factor P--beta-lysine ligase
VAELAVLLLALEKLPGLAPGVTLGLDRLLE